eukprot:TRINITY_DN869_c0_g3_i2.p1 TRINITY_DN869_c0_g3~~TRINITY_DN869_c0_g3_i2.p1  ORF type:complete len:700 (-),score=172.43 TRINITY_DN869_c0_g3_i2:68-2077(-)
MKNSSSTPTISKREVRKQPAESIKCRTLLTEKFSEFNSVWDSLTPNERQRQEILYELIDTETQYVSDLEMIVELFVKPLKEKNLLGKKEVYSLTLNLEDILQVNKDFLKAVENQRDKGMLIELGDAFVERGDMFKIYAVYCPNQAAIGSHITAHRETNPAFAEFVKQFDDEPSFRGMPLASYLAKPVQRLCKYPLLLRELQKCTDENHPDYKRIIESSNKITVVVDLVNERTRQVDELKKMMDLSQNLIFDETEPFQLVKKSRRLISEADVTMLSKTKKQAVCLLLFNDLLIITVKKKMFYKVVNSSPTNMIVINDLNETAFEIVLVGEGTEAFEFNSTSEKESFMNNLKHYGQLMLTEQLREKQESGVAKEQIKEVQHNFKEWTFTSPTFCSFCGEFIYGLFLQGFNCAVCKDYPVHKRCVLKAPKDCQVSKNENILDSVTKMTHKFKKNHTLELIVCLYCKDVIWGKEWKCQVCAYVVHQKCLPKAPKTCQTFDLPVVSVASQNAMELVVTVLEVKDVPIKDKTGVYILLHLDHLQEFKTKVVNNTMTWNEQFIFIVKDLSSQSVQIKFVGKSTSSKKQDSVLASLKLDLSLLKDKDQVSEWFTFDEKGAIRLNLLVRRPPADQLQGEQVEKKTNTNTTITITIVSFPNSEFEFIESGREEVGPATT